MVGNKNKIFRLSPNMSGEFFQESCDKVKNAGPIMITSQKQLDDLYGKGRLRFNFNPPRWQVIRITRND